MTDTNGHNTNNRSELEKLIKNFPSEQKELVKNIWDRSAKAGPEQSIISKEETEQALGMVHDRLPDFSDSVSGSPNRPPLAWRWVAAAAVVLLLFGAGILFVPRTAEAPYGETTTVELPDGSEVELNSGSKIEYNLLYSFTNRTINLDGEAFFSVKSSDNPFLVNANHATVRVTGTKFNVRSWSNEPGLETEVTVSEGSVKLYPVNDPDSSVTISPGQLSRLTANLQKPTTPEAVSIDRFLGWRDNKLIFNNKTLGVIFLELERRFNTEIELQRDYAAHETLTTYYANPKDLESILKDICRVKGLRYAETANGYRVY
ncbi:FecR domain-containing protein [Aliifodinibius sp. S!AR15-10]|uniref:FecR family protein n=1 Tax=Aliifodinibius sp. S!AR15-10 TaxID=2950437 RepID=UPI002866821D|nr:FecR domain-containing protein [Aliifodinibius sp. S!AR15-10]MDR8389782.1 FecR domain-containing protein [Aliifodinibius sp. S!AR15-10]